MNAQATTPWEVAQLAEHDYWYPRQADVFDAHRGEERARQDWYAGLLFLRTANPGSVIELGAGPAGLLTRFARHARVKIAVEPLELSDDDLAAYAENGASVARARAEDISEAVGGPPGEDREVWMTNVLQHCEDPHAVLERAKRLASTIIRLFEWVHEPTSIVHLHTITPLMIDSHFARGWRALHRTDGVATTPSYCQRFVAVVYERVAP